MRLMVSYGGRKATLNQAHALVTVYPNNYVNLTSEDIKLHIIIIASKHTCKQKTKTKQQQQQKTKKKKKSSVSIQTILVLMIMWGIMSSHVVDFGFICDGANY